MKAIVQERYGAPEEVLELREVERPLVREAEALVRVRASAVAGDDWHLVRGLPYLARLVTGLRRPRARIAGRELAGRVEAVGAGVRELRVGDEVFGWCVGAFAEYASVPEAQLALKPAGLTFDQAAVVPVSGFTALQALRDEGRLQPGQAVLVLGASGGVGTFAVQLAKALGAEVTGVCSTPNVDLVRSLGADHVLDYTREDFTRSERRYDLIVDLVASRSLSDCRRALTPAGTLVLVGSSGLSVDRVVDRWLKGTERWLAALLLSAVSRQRLRPLVHADRKQDLLFLKERIEAGQLRPVVSATHELSEVAAAIRRFEQGHARGKVALTI